MGKHVSKFLSDCGEPIEPISWNPIYTLHPSSYNRKIKEKSKFKNFLIHTAGNLVELTPNRCKVQRIQFSLSNQHSIDKDNFHYSKQVVTVHHYGYEIGNSVDCYDSNKLTGLSLHKIFTHFPSLVQAHLDLTTETTDAILWATQFRHTVQIPLIESRELNVYYLHVANTSIRKRMR